MKLIPKIKRGFVLAVSAPSGTGKTSLCDKLASELKFCVRSISVTTRPQRPGEVSGKDYTFVNQAEFKSLEKDAQFLETAEVFGNWYGTPRTPVESSLAKGEVIVMDIDVKGALNVKRILGLECVTVFIVPPSMEELETRLKSRGKDAPEELQKRLSEATREMKQAIAYEYIMPNVAFDEAFDQLKGIVFAERAKRERLEFPLV